MSRRRIPGVDRVLEALGETEMPRAVVVDCVRRELAVLRACDDIPGEPEVLDRVREALRRLRRSRLQPVINGTGILIHTNLGRVPLGDRAVEAVRAVARTYSNLEFDLDRGRRGDRASYLEHALALLCRAEAATVVNNCAAALVLILRRFCRRDRDEVVISRGELIQIGGGFRIPDILETGGARLREIGTTNRTTLEDYAGALGNETAMILKVHRSNFFMEGFVASPSSGELAALAAGKRVPLVEDLGSGAVIDTETIGPIEHEPTPRETLRRGVHLVCFSGDKLLGGPQAGIIAGKRRHIRAMKKDPLFRALRCDKLVLSALQATVESYLAHGRRERPGLPLVDMLVCDTETLRARAHEIAARLREAGCPARIGAGRSRVGGGALPRLHIPSVTVEVNPSHLAPGAFAALLREQQPPVIGTITDGLFSIDLRTVFPGEDEILVRAIIQALLDHRGTS